MRDPERVVKVLHLVYKIWKKWPDMRLMQLLMAPFNKGEDLFNLEE